MERTEKILIASIMILINCNEIQESNDTYSLFKVHRGKDFNAILMLLLSHACLARILLSITV